MRKSREERLEYFEQKGKWSKKEHLRRHKELIKQKKAIRDAKKSKKDKILQPNIVTNLHAKRHAMAEEYNRLVREGDKTTKIKREQLHVAIKEIEDEIETRECNARASAGDIEAS